MKRIENYGTKPPFANMLPGIAGPHGIPCWCFTVSRGQAVTSFGLRNKNHGITRFSPMPEACRTVKTECFRTFVLADGTLYEPFADATLPHEMETSMADLHLRERCAASGLTTEVRYWGLPEAAVGGLVRTLTLRNDTDAPIPYALLDGLATLTPYGVSLDMLQSMGQTVQAWMQVDETPGGLPYFHVRASVEDSIAVSTVTEGNFAFAVDEDGHRLPTIFDPGVIFGWDTSLQSPENLALHGLAWVLAQPQQRQNRLPCCFFAREGVLAPGEQITIHALYGQAASMALADAATHIRLADTHGLAVTTIQHVTAPIASRTGNPAFDAYCRQTWLDNVLRGGLPLKMGGKILHLYARKHGDIERDYNDFQLSPEPYAQGNGNFRDICQNRRSDVLFAPHTGTHTLHTFIDLIQPDGYNPLVLMPSTFSLDDTSSVLALIAPESQALAGPVLRTSFTPGALYAHAQSWTLQEGTTPDDLLTCALSGATEHTHAQFGEGYWTDHWTYLLDLVEAYLAVYPDRAQAALFADDSYRYYTPQAHVQPRASRYQLTAKGVRQYHPLAHVQTEQNHAAATLMEKLLLLITVKYATLDPYGLGIEMEAGKPGWYDALNGLPGLIGSSVTELCELARLMHFVLAQLKAHGCDVALPSQLADLLDALHQLTGTHLPLLLGAEDITPYWQAANDAREHYRAQVYAGMAASKRTYTAAALQAALAQWLRVADAGIAKACKRQDGLCPAYFYYEVTNYAEEAHGLLPLAFVQHSLPDFLEGPVRWLKLPHALDAKAAMAQRVRHSGLYDEKLRMYKVNAPLAGLTYEAGRAVVFTPGWLENESIWLHMAYKYMLALFQSELYGPFIEAFQNGLIPFQDMETYGRSTLENVSFIASSANPDPATHGRGFVARLSGSTAEFVQLWQWMMIGRVPFTMEADQLCLRLAPCIPASLMPEDGLIQATLLGHTAITYHAEGLATLMPGEYTISRIELRPKEGMPITIQGDAIRGEAALAVREGQYAALDITLVPHERSDTP